MKDMTTTHAIDLDRICEQYQHDDYAVLPALLDATECAALKAEARSLLDRPDAPEGVWRSASVYLGAALASPLFHQLAADRRLLPLLWRLIPEGPMFLSDKLVFKSAAQRFASPWHVDAAYWPNTRPKLSLWIALDDVAADNGALVVLPGSHQRAWRHDHGAGINGKGEFVHTVKPDWNPAQELVCAVPRGSVIVFGDRLLHASRPNTAGADRFSLISTYHAVGADEPFDAGFPARRALPRP